MDGNRALLNCSDCLGFTITTSKTFFAFQIKLQRLYFTSKCFTPDMMRLERPLRKQFSVSISTRLRHLHFELEKFGGLPASLFLRLVGGTFHPWLFAWSARRLGFLDPWVAEGQNCEIPCSYLRGRIGFHFAGFFLGAQRDTHTHTGKATKGKVQDIGEVNKVMPLPLPSSDRVRG